MMSSQNLFLLLPLVLPAWLAILSSPLTLSSISVSAQVDLIPRCGDCWCTFHGELDECPSDTTGIADSFSSGLSIYASFTQTNDVIKLQAPDGDENCNPFANTLGAVDDYPESNWPQCEIPESTDTTVCAYLYEDSPTAGVEEECRGRNYQMLTYDSVEAAEAVGAAVTHKGACGVCSNTQDLWARMNTLDTFETKTVVCAALYGFDPNPDTRFNSLVECAEKEGLTRECAKLWAHYGAATVAVCGSTCPLDGTTGAVQYNGPAPECELGECLDCPKQYNANFNAISGRTLQGSGITEAQARPCSAFFPVVHDPCVGAQATVSPAPTPQPTPDTSGGAIGKGPIPMVLLVFIMTMTTIMVGTEGVNL